MKTILKLLVAISIIVLGVLEVNKHFDGLKDVLEKNIFDDEKRLDSINSLLENRSIEISVLDSIILVKNTSISKHNKKIKTLKLKENAIRKEITNLPVTNSYFGVNKYFKELRTVNKTDQ